MLKTCSPASPLPGEDLAAELESGKILFFAEPPFPILDRELLNGLDLICIAFDPIVKTDVEGFTLQEPGQEGER